MNDINVDEIPDTRERMKYYRKQLIKREIHFRCGKNGTTGIDWSFIRTWLNRLNDME